MMKPKVSIRLMTYNQEKFIARAMDGIMMQKTDFPVEVVVGDDFSQDNTLSIIKQYENTENIKIKILDRKKGDDYWKKRQKKGRLYNFINILENCDGEYIALLDGDDYWIDEYKLQKQITYLENNPQSAACFHDVITVDENHEVISEKYFIPQRNKYNFIQNLKELKSSYATCSLVFRSKVLVNMPNWYKNIPCDFTTDILITQFGTLDYLAETMAAYRIHKGGVWQGSQKEKHFAEMAYRYLILLKSGQFKQQKSIILNEYLTAQRKLVAFQMKKSEKLKTIKKVFSDFSLFSLVPYRFIYLVAKDYIHYKK